MPSVLAKGGKLHHPHPYPPLQEGEGVKKLSQVVRAGRDVGAEGEADAKGLKLPKFYSGTS
jgi:hypothetical protein